LDGVGVVESSSEEETYVIWLSHEVVSLAWLVTRGNGLGKRAKWENRGEKNTLGDSGGVLSSFGRNCHANRHT
jgi:hypothetical protein